MNILKHISRVIVIAILLPILSVGFACKAISESFSAGVRLADDLLDWLF